jgi:hypothetical protein
VAEYAFFSSLPEQQPSGRKAVTDGISTLKAGVAWHRQAGILERIRPDRYDRSNFPFPSALDALLHVVPSCLVFSGFDSPFALE